MMAGIKVQALLPVPTGRNRLGIRLRHYRPVFVVDQVKPTGLWHAD